MALLRQLLSFSRQQKLRPGLQDGCFGYEHHPKPNCRLFQVSGTDGVTGRANVTVPIQFNSTAIKVKVDNSMATATVLKDPVNYYVFFTFPLSTHTISLTYASPPSGLPIVLIVEIVGVVAAVVITAAILLFLRRRKRLVGIRPPGPEAQPPPTPPPIPSPQQPTHLQLVQR